MKKDYKNTQHLNKVVSRRNKTSQFLLTIPCTCCVLMSSSLCTGFTLPSHTAPSSESTNSTPTSSPKNHKKNHQRKPNSVAWKKSNGENFALHMASIERSQDYNTKHNNDENDDSVAEHSKQNNLNNEENTLERRKFLQGLFAASTGASIATTSQPASAYENAFPQTLDFENGNTSINLESIRGERISTQKSMAQKSKSDLLSSPLTLRTGKDVGGSIAWGAALWLLSGSRSNPLVKPLANALYDENTNKGAWVKDRNEGLFAPIPAAFAILIGVIFLALGVVTDRFLLLITEGNSSLVLQLAGVSLIGGGSLELGRIASGEKKQTREEADRDMELVDEFITFAEKKLVVKPGGSVHRSEVIRAFRRFYAKYRVDNEEYPLTDLEIERLVRRWQKSLGSSVEMTSAGFLKGVQIDNQGELR